MLRKHTFKLILHKSSLKMMGFLEKNKFGLSEIQERQCEGYRECLKNYHINLIKLKHAFLQVRQSQNQLRKTPLKHRSFREKLLVTKQSRDNCDSLCMKLKIFQFLPKKHFARKVNSEIPARQQRDFLNEKCDFLFSLKHISWEALSRELLAKQPLNQFLKKNTKMHFEQKLKARKFKITFKNI